MHLTLTAYSRRQARSLLTCNLVTIFEELGNNPLRWMLTRNGENISVSDYMTGELSADSGKVQFKQSGNYRLKASFTDVGGRTYSYEQAFTVYPIPVVAWTMPNYGHTDDTFKVAVESKNVSDVEGTAIDWHIDDTYGLRQNWETYVSGNLGAAPGNIRIKHAGVFTLGCEVTDAIGRVFSFDDPSPPASPSPLFIRLRCKSPLPLLFISAKSSMSVSAVRAVWT